MNLPLGKSPALSARLARMNADIDRLDEELDAQDAARVLREAFDAQVTKFLRRAVPDEAPR